MNPTDIAAAPGTTDRSVETPRYRIRYLEAGTGHPVVLLHGGGPGATGESNYAPNIGPLGKHFRVLVPDMPGWGQSDPSTEGGRDHADALIAMLDALGIERAALVGNSVGGMTAVTAAITYPDRVSHLITMGAPAPTRLVFSPAGGPSEGMKALTTAYGDPTPANIKRLVQVMCFDPGFASDELVRTRTTAALAHPEHLANWNAARTGTGAVSPYFDLETKVGSITAPTMAIHGRDDRVVNYENSLHLTTRISNSRLVLINRCGHWAQLEHAAEFNRLVTSFVNQA